MAPCLLLRICLWLFLPLSIHPVIPAKNITPLVNGYAHNDYWHKRPLLDALEKGYTHIEADIFKVGSECIVAHLFPFFRKGKTLENLYLKPLYGHIREHGGEVYPGYGKPIVLMIDIKLNANTTYRMLRPLLEKYRSMLTSYENGVITERQVTIVISGNKPYQLMQQERTRYAFIDESLTAIRENNFPNSLCPIASCHYGSLLNWNGEGAMPETEKARLIGFVNAAHTQGKKVRLWASPEKTAVWNELLNCGVDLVNTDQLDALRDFLLTRRDIAATAASDDHGHRYAMAK
ncbi:phosphatidylinositol-specific phospholipase C/glycerophosphodiester phosphodiesterase family protein [Sediminibacterium soli]|uniref:phosphatidylinositol-specific phospholipase C/glycerophosphodiester phosphodiesterase family protein n=1 Tax=Sediminibacterium soli TaxID=2698829 RepID=UPI001379AA69|nr:phosphatidylinositol-specific phospholipase C/glycerophosphodiester phosphodiesterase family protein [Sediminibacterium soli]NCI47977.1 hypothetical protein [Sediminibacterium soli]